MGLEWNFDRWNISGSFPVISKSGSKWRIVVGAEVAPSFRAGLLLLGAVQDLPAARRIRRIARAMIF